jgi:CheY-like chemotaxis protein
MESILLVDDDELFCAMVEIALQRLGYSVVSTNDPREALGWVRGRPSQWHIMISDFMMPHMRGNDLVRAVKEISPNMLCLVFTGYAADHGEQAVRDAGADGFLKKPFEIDQLARAIIDLQKSRV